MRNINLLPVEVFLFESCHPCKCMNGARGTIAQRRVVIHKIYLGCFLHNNEWWRTRSSWLNCALRDAVYWVGIWAFVPLYNEHSGDLERCHGFLTDWLTHRLRKKELLSSLQKYKSGALVIFVLLHFSQDVIFFYIFLILTAWWCGNLSFHSILLSSLFFAICIVIISICNPSRKVMKIVDER